MESALMDDVSRETEGLIPGEEPLPDMPPPPGKKTADPEAPYGFTTDGKVRGRPGRKPGAAKATGAGLRKAIAPPKKAAPRPGPPPRKTATDYRPALMSFMGDIIGSAALWGLMRDDMVIIADTASVWRATPSIVDGLNTAADRWPVVGTLLDKFLPLAEFGKSGGALVLLTAQIAVNHKMMPPGLIPGTTTPEAVASAFINEMVHTNKDFAAAVASIQAAQAAARTVSEPGLN